METTQNKEVTWSECCTQHFAETEQRIQELHTSSIQHGKNTAIVSDAETYLSDQNRSVALQMLESKVNVLLVNNKSWHDLQTSAAESRLYTAKTKLNEYYKEKHRLELLPKVEIPTQEQPKQLPSKKATRNKLTGNYAMLILVMLGEWILISQSFQRFGDNKLFSFLIGGAFSMGLAIAYAYLPKLLQKIASPLWKSAVAFCLFTIVIGALVATAVFRNAYAQDMGKATVHIAWLILISAFFNLITYLLIHEAIGSGQKSLQDIHQANSQQPVAPKKESTLEDVLEQIKYWETEKEAALNFKKEIVLAAETTELMIYHTGWIESIAQWKFAYITVRNAIPDTFLNLEVAKLKFYFIKSSDITNE